MAATNIPPGFVPVIGTTAENTAAITPISVAASTALVIPAKLTGASAPASVPTGTAGATGWGIKGPIFVNIVIEGTAACRYTWNGVTPTTAIGQLTATPSATVAVPLTFLAGLAMLQAFRIIQAAGSASITYQFYAPDAR